MWWCGTLSARTTSSGGLAGHACQSRRILAEARRILRPESRLGRAAARVPSRKRVPYLTSGRDALTATLDYFYLRAADFSLAWKAFSTSALAT